MTGKGTAQMYKSSLCSFSKLSVSALFILELEAEYINGNGLFPCREKPSDPKDSGMNEISPSRGAELIT